MEKKISVIIANLNSTIIDKTILSIKQSSYNMNAVEVIVVGMDQPGLIVTDDLVKFIPTAMPTIPSTARNIGVKHASGEILLFTDADCIVDNKWISILLQCHAEGKLIVGGAVDFEPGNYWTFGDNIAAFHPQLRTSPRRIVEREVLGTANFSIRKEIFTAEGGFNESRDLLYSEDNEFQFRLREKGHKIYFEPDAVVYHYPPRGSLKAVIRHAKGYAESGAVLMDLHPEIILRRKWYWKYPILLIILSPINSLVHVFNVFKAHKWLRAYFYVIPAVFIFSMCWNVYSAGAIIRNRYLNYFY